MCSLNQRGEPPKGNAEGFEVAGPEGIVDGLEQTVALTPVFGDFQHRRDPEVAF